MPPTSDNALNAADASRVTEQAGLPPGETNVVGAAPVVVLGQELRLFDHLPPLIEAMVRDIRAARRRVWMESYIFANDAAGRAVAEALAERAAAGIDVRLMIDALGSLSLSKKFLAGLTAAGVQLHVFHTLAFALSRWRLFWVMNRRNHRKLLVIDDDISYFGGMNIVDDSDMTSLADWIQKRLPSSAGWRDVHVRMAGDRQADIATAMDRLWRKCHHQKRGEPWPRWPIETLVSDTDEEIQFFDFRPSIRYRRAQRVFVPLIRRAEKSVTLSMAYFVPVGAVLRELLRARRRGVKVRVIIPGESDVPAVRWAARHMYGTLLSSGIHIYERSDRMLHSKVMIVDSRWTVVGSCNLDPRSLRLNLEFLGTIASRPFAAAVESICRYEIRHSRRVTADDFRNRTFWQRLVDRVAWYFRHWL